MKLFTSAVLATLIVFAGSLVSAKEKAPQGFAVVELFTSEGCSSCPPADELMISLNERAKAENLPIYILGFHVNYWNYLGWEDRFSHPYYSDRQREYAHHFKIQSYTPQVVVNGQKVFVGSDKSKLNHSVKDFLAEKTPVDLKLGIKKEDKKYFLTCHVANAAESDVLQVAIVEDGVQSQVASGENAGRTLHHTNAVRSFQTVPLNKLERISIPEFSREWTVDQLYLVAYIQNPSDKKIKAAAKIRLQDLPVQD